MMIARNWMQDSATVEGHRYRFPAVALSPEFANVFAGVVVRRIWPSKRDREVPYGMKGGEY
jgi:hypothetical protein